MRTEQEERDAVVSEALTWLRTPYHHMGRVKGVGVDCGMILAEVFERAGLIPHVEIEYYPMDWALHRSEERYLGWIKDYSHEIKDRDPLPGDIVLYQFGRCISHAAIVIKWPQIIHSYVRIGVVFGDANESHLASRQRALYSYWR